MTTLAVVLAASVAAEDTTDLRIGARPAPAGPRQITPEEFQAVVQRLAANPPAPPPPAPARPKPNDAAWEKSDAVAALAEQARQDPELFARLLIPPGYPRSVPHADQRVRARAAVVLGLSRDLRALQPLVDSSVYDPDDAVRLAAAKALRQLGEPSAMRKLVDLAIARDRQKFPWPVRKSACAALRRYGDPAAVERLLRELSYELAGGNQLDPKNRLRGVPAGIGTDNPLGMADPPPSVQLPEPDLYPVLAALKEVTGLSFDRMDKDVRTWQRWWQKEGAKFVFPE